LGRLKINIEEGKPYDLPAAKQKLSILIGVDSFDYIITDEAHQISVFKSYALRQNISSNSYTEFEDFFRSDRLLNRSYKQCAITTSSPYYTLVPKKLFKPAAAAEYLEQVAALNAKFQATVDAVHLDQQVNVFGLHTFLKDWCQNRFPNAKPAHLISNLLRFAQHDLKSDQANRLYFYKTGDLLAVVLIKSHRLHFSNIFQVQVPEQLIYYLGLLFNQFSVSQLDTFVYTLGNLEAGDEFYEVLDRYLNNIQALALPAPFSLLGKLNEAPLNLMTLSAVALL
jgi:hypothetical protein